MAARRYIYHVEPPALEAGCICPECNQRRALARERARIDAEEAAQETEGEESSDFGYAFRPAVPRARRQS